MKKQVKLSKVAYKLDEDVRDEIKELGLDIDSCEVLRKSFGLDGTTDVINKSDVDKEERVCIRYVSTRNVDEAGDIVVPKGVNFELFKKRGSPIFFNHDYSTPQIGKAEWIKRDQKGIKVKQRYAYSEDKSALCNYLFELVQQGMNTQSSVGIIPTEVINIGDANFKSALKLLSTEWPELKKTAKSCRRIITKCLLFEFSDVGLGCNADTSVVSKSIDILKEAGADENLLKQLGLLGLQELQKVEKDGDKIDVKSEESEESEGGVNEDKSEDKDIKSTDLDDKEGDIKEEAVEKKVEKVEKVTLVKEPTVVKLIQAPQYKINKEEIKESISAEIRKKMGRLL